MSLAFFLNISSFSNLSLCFGTTRGIRKKRRLWRREGGEES